MGMFDHYQPQPPILWNGAELRGWQGKNGPCKLLVWQQGETAPISQRMDAQWRDTPEKLGAYRLPDGEFKIYTYTPNHAWIEASIVVSNGVWIRSRLIGSGGAEPFRAE